MATMSDKDYNLQVRLVSRRSDYDVLIQSKNG
jgi:hypothetical protein